MVNDDGAPSRKAARRGESFIHSHENHPAFGDKTIGMFAGVALLINNITGPGVPQLPNMFAEAGWLVPTLLFILIWSMTSVSATMYAEAMRKIPGNEHFRGRLEYTSIVDYYFGRKGYIAAQIGLNGALQSLNIISVMQSAQVMDKALAAMFKQSCALNLTPFYVFDNTTLVDGGKTFWSCVNMDELNGNDNPWGCHIVITAGFVLTLAMAVPMGYFNLDDNMIVQVVAFILTVACWLVWFVSYFYSEQVTEWRLEAINSDPNYGSQAAVLGTILFNFGFVTTVPSWVNEKKPSVSVNKSIWYSTTACIFIFFVLGIPGAMAFKDILQGPATNTCARAVADPQFTDCSSDVMSILVDSTLTPPALLKHSGTKFVMALSVYLFPVVAVVSSIPVFSIVIKYNCIENGWSKRSSLLWGVLFPWIISIPLLYQPGALNQLITFSSLFFVSFTDFIVPWMLYVVMTKNDVDSSRTKLYGIQEDVEQMDHENVHETDALLNRGVSKYKMLEHFAIPQSWGLSATTKIRVAYLFVVVMGGLAAAGTIMQIVQNAGQATVWDCPSVGGS